MIIYAAIYLLLRYSIIFRNSPPNSTNQDFDWTKAVPIDSIIEQQLVSDNDSNVPCVVTLQSNYIKMLKFETDFIQIASVSNIDASNWNYLDNQVELNGQYGIILIVSDRAELCPV